MDSSSSIGIRHLFQTLVTLAIQRCRLAGCLCSLTISLKCNYITVPPSLRFSISDTGVGSSLAEYQSLDIATLGIMIRNWDGVLSITTTGISDREIHRYVLNLRESVSSSRRLATLPTTTKSIGSFSGTEVCISVEEQSADDIVKWVVQFFRKMLILKAPDHVIGLLIEYLDSTGSRCENFGHKSDDISLPLTVSYIERLVAGLEDYVLKRRNALPKECASCSSGSKNLIFGKGEASSIGGKRRMGQTVEVVVMIMPVLKQPCCSKANCSSTEVLYFQDFSPCSTADIPLNALASINWQVYGLKLSSSFVNHGGYAVLEWAQMFDNIDIAIHIRHKNLVQKRQNMSSKKNLVKKAVKMALDDIKASHAGIFLSSNVVKIRGYVPDLSRSIASLIMSSEDLAFQSECATLLNLSPNEAGEDDKLESCIRERIMVILEVNDKKRKWTTEDAPLLFECEGLDDEDFTDEEHDNVDYSYIDYNGER